MLSSKNAYEILAKLVEEQISAVFLSYQEKGIIKRFSVDWRNPSIKFLEQIQVFRQYQAMIILILGYFEFQVNTTLNSNSDIEIEF